MRLSQRFTSQVFFRCHGSIQHHRQRYSKELQVSCFRPHQTDLEIIAYCNLPIYWHHVSYSFANLFLFTTIFYSMLVEIRSSCFDADNVDDFGRLVQERVNNKPSVS